MSLLTAERDPSWIGCVDFGTALSKAAMVRARPRNEVLPSDIVPLAIAERDGVGARNPLLLPSVVYIDDKTIVFGQEAEDAALRGEQRQRHAFRSLKQYLSTHDLEDLDGPLPIEIDPTGKYTPRAALELFLAHLLERAGASARKEGKPWPVRLRIARPAWDRERADQGEQELKAIVRHAFALVDALGKKLSARGGLDHKTAMKALEAARAAPAPDDERLFQLDRNRGASVLEATAVAAGSIRDTGRRVVAVADIGGGTSDFGAFMTGLPGRAVLAEIDGSADALRQAGDHLDMLLVGHVLNELGYQPDDPAGRGVASRIRRRQRQYKEALFSDGEISIDVGDEVVTLTVAELLDDKRVQEFARTLRERFDRTLRVAIACAEAYPHPTHGGRTRVEILLTGGGHALPMVRDLYEHPSRDWTYAAAAPDFAQRPEHFDFHTARRQLVVAVGGALRDLPVVTAAVRIASPAT